MDITATSTNTKYRAIIVDDEPPALAKLGYLLKDYEDFELVGSFDNADDALESASSLQPQVAFLDIAMPGRNGMELALELQARLADNIEIIFVTAFDQYAVSAFDLDATDYLLKPVSKERFHKSILRIKNTLETQTAAPRSGVPSSPMLHAFGKLEITGTNTPQPEWRTAKVRELFALYLQNRPNGVFRKNLLDTLFSTLPEEKALSNLNTCNYYLRQFLKETGTDITLKYKSGYYSLDLGNVTCDADLFADAEEKAGSITSGNLDSILYGASLYRGKYFEDVKCDWANLLRDQYDIRYSSLRVALASYYASLGKYEESGQQASLALETDPFCDSAWKILLCNYKEMADQAHYDTTIANRSAAYQSRGLTAPPLEV